MGMLILETAIGLRNGEAHPTGDPSITLVVMVSSVGGHLKRQRQGGNGAERPLLGAIP